MNIAHDFYSITLLLAAALSLWHAATVWQRPLPITRPITVFLLGMTWWSSTYALHWSQAPRPYPTFWLEATYVGVVTVPTAFFVFTLRYIGRDHWLTRPWLILLPIEPVLTLILLWTDSHHGWFFGGNIRDGNSLFNGGPWFWFNVIYSYGLMLLSTFLLAHAYEQAAYLYKGQARIILAGALLPWAVNALMFAGVEPLPGLDLTPIAFTLTGLSFAYGIRYYRLLDVLPVARDALIEKMTDGIIVIDAQNRLVDINSTGQWMLHAPGTPPIGQPIEPLLAHWQNLVERFRDIQEGQFQLEIGGEPPQFVDLRIVPLHHHKGQYTGRLLMLRDITRLKRTELELRQANGELRSRVAQIESLQTKLQESAIRDALTGLYNRRYLEDALERELSSAAETHQPLSLLMLDIDHFKEFNDSHGHIAGDTLLQALGNLLNGSIHNREFACRYGGEEFAVVIPDTQIEEAVHLAEHLRQSLEQTAITHRGTHLQATLSIGVANYPTQASNSLDLLNCADQALYTAKRNGRNQIVVYNGRIEGQVSANSQTK